MKSDRNNAMVCPRRIHCSEEFYCTPMAIHCQVHSFLGYVELLTAYGSTSVAIDTHLERSRASSLQWVLAPRRWRRSSWGGESQFVL